MEDINRTRRAMWAWTVAGIVATLIAASSFIMALIAVVIGGLVLGLDSVAQLLGLAYNEDAALARCLWLFVVGLVFGCACWWFSHYSTERARTLGADL